MQLGVCELWDRDLFLCFEQVRWAVDRWRLNSTTTDHFVSWIVLPLRPGGLAVFFQTLLRKNIRFIYR